MYTNLEITLQHPVKWREKDYHPDFWRRNASILRENLTTSFKSILEKAEEMAQFNNGMTLKLTMTPGHGFLYPLANEPLAAIGIFAHPQQRIAGAAFPNTSTKIVLYLKSSTCLQSQMPDLQAAFAHEIGHMIFDKDSIRSLIDNANEYMKFQDHKEYRANAFGAEIIGREAYSQSLARLLTPYPHNLNQIYATSRGLYTHIALDSLQKCKDAASSDTRFCSWQDYLDNEAKYLSAQPVNKRK